MLKKKSKKPLCILTIWSHSRQSIFHRHLAIAHYLQRIKLFSEQFFGPIWWNWMNYHGSPEDVSATQCRGTSRWAHSSDLKLHLWHSGLQSAPALDASERFVPGAFATLHVHVSSLAGWWGDACRPTCSGLLLSLPWLFWEETLTPCSLQVHTHTHTRTQLQCKLICVSFSVQNPWSTEATEIWYQFISPRPFPSVVFKGENVWCPHGPLSEAGRSGRRESDFTGEDLDMEKLAA